MHHSKAMNEFKLEFFYYAKFKLTFLLCKMSDNSISKPCVEQKKNIQWNISRDIYMSIISLKILPISGQNRQYFVPWDLEIWWMTLENNRAPFLYYIKLCALFQSHGWIQTVVEVRKYSIRVKICDFFVPCDLEIWQMTLKNNRAPLLYCFKLCASSHSHQWIQTGVRVR